MPKSKDGPTLLILNRTSKSKCNQVCPKIDSSKPSMQGNTKKTATKPEHRTNSFNTPILHCRSLGTNSPTTRRLHACISFSSFVRFFKSTSPSLLLLRAARSVCRHRPTPPLKMECFAVFPNFCCVVFSPGMQTQHSFVCFKPANVPAKTLLLLSNKCFLRCLIVFQSWPQHSGTRRPTNNTSPWVPS